MLFIHSLRKGRPEVRGEKEKERERKSVCKYSSTVFGYDCNISVLSFPFCHVSPYFPCELFIRTNKYTLVSLVHSLFQNLHMTQLQTDAYKNVQSLRIFFSLLVCRLQCQSCFIPSMFPFLHLCLPCFTSCPRPSVWPPSPLLPSSGMYL